MISYKFNHYNPDANSNPKWAQIPGFRGQDEMCIYDSSYPFITKDMMAGTNPWGIEASVNSQGIVEDISDRVRLIKDGYIISGNGTAAKFIEKNIFVGSKITLNLETQEIMVENDFKEIFEKTKTLEYKNLLERYKQVLANRDLFEVESVNSNLEVIKMCDDQKVFTQKVIETNNMLADSPFVSARAVWARPEEIDLKSITKRLDYLQACNINAVYLECFYNGEVPYQSIYTDTLAFIKKGNYGKYGQDYLLAFITEANLRGIEVHAWVENFFVGENSSYWKPWYKDSWHMINYNHLNYQGAGDGNAELLENGFIFLDPANPECLDYILKIYEEMLTKYSFSGINIDYVRYPHGNLNLETTNGYTQYAVEEFLKLNDLRGNIRELVKDPQIMTKWTDYRVGKIDNLVVNIYHLVKRINNQLLISMAVVDDIPYARANKMQDWVKWVDKGYIDIVFPMAYYIGKSEVLKTTEKLVEVVKDNAYSYPGIMPVQSGTTEKTIYEQINSCYEKMAQGYNIFQINNLIDCPYAKHILRNGNNRYKAVSPHQDLKMVMEAMIAQINLKAKMYQLDVGDLVLALTNYKKEMEESFDLYLEKLASLAKGCMLTKDISYLTKILLIKKNRRTL